MWCSDLQVGVWCSDLQVGVWCSDLQVGVWCSDLQVGVWCSDLQVGVWCSDLQVPIQSWSQILRTAQVHTTSDGSGPGHLQGQSGALGGMPLQPLHNCSCMGEGRVHTEAHSSHRQNVYSGTTL